MNVQSIFDTLKFEHETILDEMRRLGADVGGKAKQARLVKVSEQVREHFENEEMCVYDKFAEKEKTDMLLEPYEKEHSEISEALTAIAVPSIPKSDWLKKVQDLRSKIDSHFTREQNELFPQMRKAFATWELEKIQDAYLNLRKGKQSQAA